MSSDASRLTSDQFRQAAGRFATGITVATAVDGNGQPHGLTVNSFTSVSLEPPLVLICLGHHTAAVQCFRSTKHFGINILADDQRWLSEHFARKGYDRFETIEWHRGETGVPLLPGVVAVMECDTYRCVEMGDHDIFVGRVARVEICDRAPLLYFASGYRRVEKKEHKSEVVQE
jgi:flavin reductase (DIM6/NTAB) family NADH-FMN oxidoreductase RutF